MNWKAAVSGLAAAALLGGAAWVLLVSDVVGVARIEVVGRDRLPESQVVASAGVPLGFPMLRLDLDDLERKVKSIKQVETAEIVREWPGTLRISIKERVPLVMAEIAGRFVQIDRHGVAVEITATSPERRLPRLNVARIGPDDPATKSALTVLNTLPDEIVRRLSALEAPTPEGVTLRFTDGRSVIWGGPERAAEKLKALSALLRLRGTIYNVSSPGAVSVK
ncbi:cell division protein FtsQ/DivIB [Rhizohabitans arisaemae]|uniref:cell division protein FtsQ/DivIB n=1 Tax=Rhizohabitans arisaemae TaxID=2720610 RepID=UPI0024B055BF|nr:FtsQ-type POTRA domain-containing protein [Rhizohabitans arisaemae]